jgi:two-component system, chemotaxis family, CheB/CheR fusion protein
MQSEISAELDAREAQYSASHQQQIIAIIAHELRGPLAAMSNALAVCRNTATGTCLDLRAAELLARQLHKANRLVDDLLDMAHRGLRDMHISTVDLAQIVQDATDEIRHKISARHQVLSLDMPGSQVLISGDGLRLERVVTNLLDNSSKYTPMGGHINVRLTLEEDDAVLRVRDSGRGISPQDLGRIFELFFRSEQLTDEVAAGIGIGLALARWIIELHGGTISAHSDGPDKGAEFTVRVPALLALQPCADEGADSTA